MYLADNTAGNSHFVSAEQANLARLKNANLATEHAAFDMREAATSPPQGPVHGCAGGHDTVMVTQPLRIEEPEWQPGSVLPAEEPACVTGIMRSAIVTPAGRCPTTWPKWAKDIRAKDKNRLASQAIRQRNKSTTAALQQAAAQTDAQLAATAAAACAVQKRDLKQQHRAQMQELEQQKDREVQHEREKAASRRTCWREGIPPEHTCAMMVPPDRGF
jgi:hypothetical protein